jgi:glycine betaine catabolism A
VDYSPRRTLSGHDYRSEEVFALERQRIFHRGWFYVGRDEHVSRTGDRLVVDVAGESVLVVRGRGEALHAFYNVCRHRGAQLCDGSGPGAAAITCPYHGWSYALTGELIGTPNVDREELDRRALSLWRVAVDVWEGFMFVSLGSDPPPLRAWLADQFNDPFHLQRFGLAGRRIARHTVAEVAANWKIIVENFSECLHCSRVHPELVDLIPTYKSGSIVEPGRTDHGVTLARESPTYREAGYARLAELEGDDHDADGYFGAAVFPNLFIDVTGASLVVTTLLPRAPAHTTVLADYLFTPAVMEAPGFDPAEIVEFNERVAWQDFAVCERVQRGISSRAFTHGVLAEKDAAVGSFVDRYLDVPIDLSKVVEFLFEFGSFFTPCFDVSIRSFEVFFGSVEFVVEFAQQRDASDVDFAVDGRPVLPVRPHPPALDPDPQTFDRQAADAGQHLLFAEACHDVLMSARGL